MSVQNIDDLTELLTRPESVDKIIMIDDSQTDLSKRTVQVQTDLVRGRTKILWTGPLSVVSTPTSLNGGEKFSDWDAYIVQSRPQDDSSLSVVQTAILFPEIGSLVAVFTGWSDSGFFTFQKITDTTFQIQTKTIAAGNISSIIGISL